MTNFDLDTGNVWKIIFKKKKYSILRALLFFNNSNIASCFSNEIKLLLFLFFKAKLLLFLKIIIIDF